MTNVVHLDDHRPHPRAGGNSKGFRRRFGYIRQLKSGRFHASYTGPDGTKVNGPTTFERKGDADAWLSMESAAITEGRWKPAAKPKTIPTFTAYAAGWLAGRELKPRTREEYRKLIGLPAAAPQTKPARSPRRKPAKAPTTLVDRWAQVKLDAITPAAVRQWYDTLDPSTPTKRAHLYALLRTILQTAVGEELLDSNPCTIPRAGRTKRVRRIAPATLDQLDVIRDNLDPRWHAFVDVAAWCALRFGELTALQRSDIDLDAQLIHVRRGITWVAGQPVVGLPKSEAGIRDVTIPPHLIEPLRAHLKAHAEAGKGGLVFPAVGGGYLSHGTFYKRWREARSAAGRPDLRLHDARHTGAVMAAQAGATVRELMDRLGHSTPATALLYQHVADGRAQEIARRLSEMNNERS